MGISSALGSSALLPAGLGFRNKIINGAMVVAQRGTSAVTGSGSAQYPVDRFTVYNGTGTVTFQQSTTAPTGFSNSMVATVTATGSYGTGGYTQIGHAIEGYNVADLAWGTSGAKPIVLSFWCRASVTGAYNVAIQNGGQTRSYVTTFTVNAANTWEYKTIYVNGDTTGTWATDNTAGMRIWFDLGVGSNFDTTANTWTAGSLYSTSGAVDFAANSGATFYLTGVQLEQNYQPTPFEQRPYGVELALCQRYYYLHATGSSKAIASGHYYSAAGFEAIFPLPVRMRTTPTLDYVQGTNYYRIYSTAARDTSYIFLDSYSSDTAIAIYDNATSSGTAGYGGIWYTFNAASYVGFKAEL